jgi:hypothetical protein
VGQGASWKAYVAVRLKIVRRVYKSSIRKRPKWVVWILASLKEASNEQLSVLATLPRLLWT